MAILWLYYDYTMAILWLYYGYTMAILWLYYTHLYSHHVIANPDLDD
jgi:hypothetical protein